LPFVPGAWIDRWRHLFGRQPIQREIELEHVHARFAE
jgi:hypothetical protein